MLPFVWNSNTFFLELLHLIKFRSSDVYRNVNNNNTAQNNATWTFFIWTLAKIVTAPRNGSVTLKYIINILIYRTMSL